MRTARWARLLHRSDLAACSWNECRLPWLTVPVTASSIPTQPVPSNEPRFAAHMAPLMATWSPLPSPMKSGSPMPGHSSIRVDATCCALCPCAAAATDSIDTIVHEDSQMSYSLSRLRSADDPKAQFLTLRGTHVVVVVYLQGGGRHLCLSPAKRSKKRRTDST